MAGIDNEFSDFEGKKYLNLETYRKNGMAVRTPLWFAAAPDGETLYVYSVADSGKAKRIRRDGSAKIAPCDMRGNAIGPWIAARASIVSGAEADLGMTLLNRKYWPWKQMLGLFSALRPGHRRVVIAIRTR